jgi:hypothetical protein
VAELLTDKDKKLRLAAAQTLLDRGWGRPVTPVMTDDAADLWQAHLLAARSVALELRDEREAAGQTPLIDGSAEPQPHNLLVEPALE